MTSIRHATEADLPGILELESAFPSDRLSRRALRRLLGRPSAQLWVVRGSGRAEAAQVLAAIVVLTRGNSRVARIYSLAVTPAARGRGLARALLGHAQHWAERAGMREMRLEVRSDSHAARTLYAGLGYLEHTTLPGYYEDGGDGLRLRRRLAGD